MKQPKKKHIALRTIFITLAVLAIIVLAVAIVAWSMFGTQIKAANTIERIAQDLYKMEYVGDYGFAKFLKQGGAASDEEMAEYLTEFLTRGFYQAKMKDESYGCSTLSVTSPDGSTLVGRNFDWQDCKAMIIKTKPKDGYASVSTCNLDFLGFADDWQPDRGMMDRFMALAAIYVPLDGINEKGLCIADLVIDDGTQTHQKTDLSDLTTTSAIRMILDYAATVDEAIALLMQYDMNSSAGMQHHLSITDAGGNSVVVEYIDNEMFVTETKAVTNFYLTEGSHYGIGSEQSYQRYEVLMERIEDCNGIMTENEVMAALDAVNQKNYGDYDITQWSIVYNTDTLKATYNVRGQSAGTYEVK